MQKVQIDFNLQSGHIQCNYWSQVNIQELGGIARKLLSLLLSNCSSSFGAWETTGRWILGWHYWHRMGVGVRKGCLCKHNILATGNFNSVCLYRTCHGWMYGTSQRKTGRGEYLCNLLYCVFKNAGHRSLRNWNCHVVWSSMPGKRDPKT